MKIAVFILFMANFVSAQAAWDYVQVGFPSALFSGPIQDWRDGLSTKYGVNSGMRLQQVYSAELLKTIVPQGAWIDSIGFRADSHWSGNVEGITKGYQIFMGETSIDPVSMNSEFGRNTTLSMQEVRTEGYSSGILLASDGRQRLGPWFFLPLERPFFYDPSHGNLIFDIIPTSGFAISLDFHPESEGEFGSVFAEFGSAGYPDSGEVSKGGFVSVIGMNRIPEPGVVGLVVLGGAALLATSSRRKETQG
jgi:hypothetical protein